MVLLRTCAGVLSRSSSIANGKRVFTQKSAVSPTAGAAAVATAADVYVEKSVKNTARTDFSAEWGPARAFEDIPTASAFQMICSFLPGGRYYKTELTELVLALKRDYGDIFLWPSMLGKPPNLFTHNPADFEVVFRNEGVWPNRQGVDALKYHREEHNKEFYHGVEGLISTQGEKWGKFRSVVNPVVMQPKNVRPYLQKMWDVNLSFIKRIKKIRDPATMEVPATFEEEINRWTFESVAVVALDKRLGLLEENRDNQKAKLLFEHLSTVVKLTFDLEYKPSLWKIVATPKFKKIMKAFDGIQDITSSYVSEAVQRMQQEKEQGIVKSESEKSVLEKLLHIDEKIGMVMAMDLLMAGVDTTTTAFVGIMLSLAKNTEKQAKLRNEIFKVLPNKNSDFTEDALKSMPYLRACIRESLRMYPLVMGNGRVVINDVVLSNYHVPKGTNVTMVSSSVIRDPNHYPRPSEFLPERWLRPSNETPGMAGCPNNLKGSSPFLYLPFGFGSRSCIGRRIVQMELELGVARIIRNFYVEFNYPTENAFRSLLINVPNIPLKFKFIDIE